MSIDLILLRSEAYRHILFNRRNLLNRASLVREDAYMSVSQSISQFVCLSVYLSTKTGRHYLLIYFMLVQKLIWSLMISVYLVNLMLKMMVVKHLPGHVESFSFFYPLYLLTASIIEHLVFVGTVFFMLWRRQICIPCTGEAPSLRVVETDYVITKDFNRKIYVALTFPEIAKLIPLLLQTWESSPMLLMFAGVLTLAFQYNSLWVAISYFKQKNVTGSAPVFLVAVLAKMITKLFFHSPLEFYMLGIII